MFACSKRSHKGITTYELFCLLFGIMLLGFILWHISIVWSFLMLNNIPLYTTVSIWILPWMENLSCFYIWLLWWKLLWAFLYRAFHGHIPLFLLSIFLGVGFGGHEEDLGLDLLKKACFLNNNGVEFQLNPKTFKHLVLSVI